MTRAAGFSLVELVVAMAVLVVFSTALTSLVLAGQSFARTQPELADVQQRARIVLQTLRTELSLAGAGLDRGPLAGGLGRYFPPIEASGDGGITIWYVSSRDAQTALSAPLPRGATDALIQPAARCPASDPACAFASASTAIVFDGRGCHDVLRVDSVTTSSLHVRDAPRSCDFETGAAIGQGEVRTYRVDANARQLVRRDEATGASVPVLDNVTAMNVEILDGGRHVRLTLRLAAAVPNALVPTLEVSCDVTPPNLRAW